MSDAGVPGQFLVVRGGTLQLGDLLKSAEKCERQFGRYGQSVYAEDLNAQDLVNAAGSRLPHGSMSFATAARLQAKGFELEQTLAWPHHTVWFPEADDVEYWCREFRMSFNLAISRDALGDYRVDDPNG